MIQSIPNHRTKARASRSYPLAAICCCVFVFSLASAVTAGDWPTYRHDPTRSGVAPENVSGDLSLQWTYTSTHPPRPAWPTPSEEIPRMHSDNAFHVAVADGRVFFGSSVTDEICAIDAGSGTT